MSRVNKYRGIHTHILPQNEHLNGRWVYGYLADENYINSPELEGEFLVDKDTVGQYIGVNDKNEKEVYEGDIVRNFLCIDDHGKPLYEYGKVVYNAEQIGFEIVDDEHNRIATYVNLEVIGNVYENSDLLKEVEG